MLLRAELANLGADLASEATNLQVAIRRAESVDDPALPVNDATCTENSRSGVIHVTWIHGIGCTRDHLAYEVRLERRNAWNFSRLLQRSTACFVGRGRVSGNRTATRPGIDQAGRRSSAQVAMPLLSFSQLAFPALSALLPFCSATLGLFIPVCLAQNVSMPRERVRENGKSCVILPHAVHIHTLPCL